jgi:hypothetical protein
MTMKSTLPPGPLSSAFRAAIHLLTRHSLTPLSRTAFVRQAQLLSAARGKHRSYPGGAPRLTPPPGKYKAATYLTQKGIEIPSNSTRVRGFSSTPDFVAARRLARQQSLIRWARANI